MTPVPVPVPRIGLIGVSGYGRVYLRLLEAAIQRKQVNLVAVTVINPEEEQETCARLKDLGVRLYANWQAMLEEQEDNLDLCMIPVPIHLHAEIAVAALESGANVLVEKPLAGSIAQARLIQEAERRTGRWVAVGYQDFYSASTHVIARDLAAGRIGRIQGIQWLGLWPRSKAYFSRNNWAGRLVVNGLPVRDSPLNNAMAHFLNLSLLWAGPEPGLCARPESVQGELFRHFEIESFDTAVAKITTDTGIEIQAAVTHCCSEEKPIHIRIQGSEGELNWFYRHEAVWSSPSGSAIQKLESYELSIERMFHTVLERLRCPEAPICTTFLAMPQVSVIEALHSAGPIRSIGFSDSHAKQREGIPDLEPLLKKCLQKRIFPSDAGYGRAGNLPVEAVVAYQRRETGRADLKAFL